MPSRSLGGDTEDEDPGFTPTALEPRSSTLPPSPSREKLGAADTWDSGEGHRGHLLRAVLSWVNEATAVPGVPQAHTQGEPHSFSFLVPSVQLATLCPTAAVTPQSQTAAARARILLVWLAEGPPEWTRIWSCLGPLTPHGWL